MCIEKKVKAYDLVWSDSAVPGARESGSFIGCPRRVGTRLGANGIFGKGERRMVNCDGVGYRSPELQQDDGGDDEGEELHVAIWVWGRGVVGIRMCAEKMGAVRVVRW